MTHKGWIEKMQTCTDMLKNHGYILLTYLPPGQTWKMSKTLPGQDCTFPDFTQKCVNYFNFKIATKPCNLGANMMFTAFTSLHHVYLIITTTTKTNKTQQESQIGAWLR